MDEPGTRRPRAEEVEHSEAALPGTVTEANRDVVAALRAAAATLHGELTGGAYEAFRERDPGRWPGADEIGRHFDSFAEALSAAGIARPERR
jgi:hypothetical protein